MSKLESLIAQRLKQGDEKSSKTASLAQASSAGELSAFSALFGNQTLSAEEKARLQNLLLQFAHKEQDISQDLAGLEAITAEVKAISNQAAILHGMRIKKAQAILKNYAEGAFTAWLITTYGNRQTPYNLLQYYDFYTALSEPLQIKMDQMPRQAIYTLASRAGPLDKKRQVIKNYSGASKQQLLQEIRALFPLNDEDKRIKNRAESMIGQLKSLLKATEERSFRPTTAQKNTLSLLLKSLSKAIKK